MKLVLIASAMSPQVVAAVAQLTSVEGIDTISLVLGATSTQVGTMTRTELGGGEAPQPDVSALRPETSTRGHKVGDPVRYDREDSEPSYGRVIDLMNGHAVVQFDGFDVPHVMIGVTMDKLVVIDEPTTPHPQGEAPGDGPREVRSEDVHFDTASVVQDLSARHIEGEVQAVVTVALGSGGNITVGSSEGTPLTLNLLAQAIMVADGTLLAND